MFDGSYEDSGQCQIWYQWNNNPESWATKNYFHELGLNKYLNTALIFKGTDIANKLFINILAKES